MHLPVSQTQWEIFFDYLPAYGGEIATIGATLINTAWNYQVCDFLHDHKFADGNPSEKTVRDFQTMYIPTKTHQHIEVDLILIEQPKEHQMVYKGITSVLNAYCV